MVSVAMKPEGTQKFEKSAKSIKNLIKKGKARAGREKKESLPLEKKYGKKKRKQPAVERGMVYISHLPHGFYEHQMTEFFKQFGTVTAARVIRSKKTGASKGCAFVEFQTPAVAQIVADTMNNYLMGKRLLKAKTIPPEEQKRRPRKHWNHQKNPSADYRIKMKKIYNDDTRDHLKTAKKQLINFLKMRKRLLDNGITCNTIQPVDVPKELMHLLTGGEKYIPIPDKVKTKKKSVKPSSTKEVKVEQASDDESNQSKDSDEFDSADEDSDQSDESVEDELASSDEEQSDGSEGELVFGESDDSMEEEIVETQTKKITLRSGRKIEKTAELASVLTKKMKKNVVKAPMKQPIVTKKPPPNKTKVSFKAKKNKKGKK